MSLVLDVTATHCLQFLHLLGSTWACGQNLILFQESSPPPNLWPKPVAIASVILKSAACASLPEQRIKRIKHVLWSIPLLSGKGELHWKVVAAPGDAFSSWRPFFWSLTKVWQSGNSGQVQGVPFPQTWCGNIDVLLCTLLSSASIWHFSKDNFLPFQMSIYDWSVNLLSLASAMLKGLFQMSLLCFHCSKKRVEKRIDEFKTLFSAWKVARTTKWGPRKKKVSTQKDWRNLKYKNVNSGKC